MHSGLNKFKNEKPHVCFWLPHFYNGSKNIQDKIASKDHCNKIMYFTASIFLLCTSGPTYSLLFFFYYIRLVFASKWKTTIRTRLVTTFVDSLMLHNELASGKISVIEWLFSVIVTKMCLCIHNLCLQSCESLWLSDSIKTSTQWLHDEYTARYILATSLWDQS